MSDKPKRALYIGADGLRVGVGPGRIIFVLLEGLEKQAGMAPDLSVALQLSPDEARGLAASLLRKADEAQDGSPPPPDKRH